MKQKEMSGVKVKAKAKERPGHTMTGVIVVQPCVL